MRRPSEPLDRGRRRFLQGAAALGAAWGCGSDAAEEAPPLGTRPPSSWGLPGAAELPGAMPADRVPRGILEVFLVGGLNPWDTMYVVPEHGDPARGGPTAGQQWWTFQDPADDESVPTLFSRCGGGDRPLLVPFGRDGAGKQVHFGPFVYPLRDRPDILARLRLFVMRHTVAPHQAAVPLVLSGQPRGSQRLAGMGAHINRYYAEQGPLGRTAPYSYVITPASKAATDLEADAASAVGLHPGSVRPLSVRLGLGSLLSDDLARAAVEGRRDAVDRALAFYASRFERDLVSARTGKALASRAAEDYRFTVESMARSQGLSPLFPEGLLTATGTEACETTVPLDGTGMGLRLAAHLLTRDADRPRYVQVVDPGMVEAFCGGYDTHARHVLYSSRNLVNLCRQLASVVREPGDDDPAKLNLDDHLILITTEMGRTPYPQPYMDRGLDHWPGGFVVAAIGGPIDATRAGIVGAIGEDGLATDYTTPAELRAGLLLAAGIWPFADEAFAIGDIRGARSELEAAMLLKARLWSVG